MFGADFRTVFLETPWNCWKLLESDLLLENDSWKVEKWEILLENSWKFAERSEHNERSGASFLNNAKNSLVEGTIFNGNFFVLSLTTWFLFSAKQDELCLVV